MNTSQPSLVQCTPCTEEDILSALEFIRETYLKSVPVISINRQPVVDVTATVSFVGVFTMRRYLTRGDHLFLVPIDTTMRYFKPYGAEPHYALDLNDGQMANLFVEPRLIATEMALGNAQASSVVGKITFACGQLDIGGIEGRDPHETLLAMSTIFDAVSQPEGAHVELADGNAGILYADSSEWSIIGGEPQRMHRFGLSDAIKRRLNGSSVATLKISKGGIEFYKRFGETI
jgi:hypothetical protein